MSLASKSKIYRLIIATVVFTGFSPIKSLASENLNVYELFHFDEHRSTDLDTFRVPITSDKSRVAHFFFENQHEPFNNPITYTLVLQREDRFLEVNRWSSKNPEATYCDYHPIEPRNGREYNQSHPPVPGRAIVLHLFEFDENAGRCPQASNRTETFSIKSLNQLCNTHQ